MRASGETLLAPLVVGGCFQALSPRRVKMYGKTNGETMKSGVSVPALVVLPRRLRGMAPPSMTRRERSSREDSVSERLGVALGTPRMASTNDGAGAGGQGAVERREIDLPAVIVEERVGDEADIVQVGQEFE